MFFFNKTCMALIAMQTAESMIMNGYITFIPKLFENLFGFSSSWASTMTGKLQMSRFSKHFSQFKDESHNC